MGREPAHGLAEREQPAPLVQTLPTGGSRRFAPDPIEEGPCYRLYTREFYRMVHRRLSPQGTIALQSGTVAPHDLLNFSAIYKTLQTAFPIVQRAL